MPEKINKKIDKKFRKRLEIELDAMIDTIIAHAALLQINPIYRKAFIKNEIATLHLVSTLYHDYLEEKK